MAELRAIDPVIHARAVAAEAAGGVAMDRCSLGVTYNQCVLFLGQGITRMMDVCFLTQDKFKSMLEEVYTSSAINQAKLTSFRAWCLEQRNVREVRAEINLLEFSDNEMTLQQNKSRVTWKKKEKSSASDKTQKAPDVFKGGKKDQGRLWGLFKAYLADQMKEDDVPIIYILPNDVDDKGDNEIVGDQGLSHLIQDAPLTGDVFRKDNYKVGKYLDTFIPDGPGCTHIEDHLSDGRLAVA
jgi:hypothetical protein